MSGTQVIFLFNSFAITPIGNLMESNAQEDSYDICQ